MTTCVACCEMDDGRLALLFRDAHVRIIELRPDQLTLQEATWKGMVGGNRVVIDKNSNEVEYGDEDDFGSESGSDSDGGEEDDDREGSGKGKGRGKGKGKGRGTGRGMDRVWVNFLHQDQRHLKFQSIEYDKRYQTSF